MFQAIIFDFNGVLADDEEIHLDAARQVATEEGLTLTTQTYYERYLALDDWNLFRTLWRDCGRELGDAALDALVERKSDCYYDRLKGKRVIFDGAPDAIRLSARQGPIAIASGARRGEIDSILRSEMLADFFPVIVSAEDVAEGKPHPDSYLTAIDRLRALHGAIDPGRCLAVEDSSGGIRSARSAGLRCLAVEHSCDRSHLAEADWVLGSIREFGTWFRDSAP